MFGGKAGFGVFDSLSGKYQYIKRYWDGDPDQANKENLMRANDGGIDCRGRYWIGVMNDPPLKAPGPEDKLKMNTTYSLKIRLSEATIS